MDLSSNEIADDDDDCHASLVRLAIEKPSIAHIELAHNDIHADVITALCKSNTLFEITRSESYLGPSGNLPPPSCWEWEGVTIHEPLVIKASLLGQGRQAASSRPSQRDVGRTDGGLRSHSGGLAPAAAGYPSLGGVGIEHLKLFAFLGGTSSSRGAWHRAL